MIGNTPWQVNLQRLLSSNPTQAATVSSWPWAALAVPMDAGQAATDRDRPVAALRERQFSGRLVTVVKHSAPQQLTGRLDRRRAAACLLHCVQFDRQSLSFFKASLRKNHRLDLVGRVFDELLLMKPACNFPVKRFPRPAAVHLASAANSHIEAHQPLLKTLRKNFSPRQSLA